MATQTKITDVGPVGLIPMGAYNPATPYSLLMTVLYKHDSWICTAMTDEGDEKEITNIAPDDPLHGAENWQALTDGGRAAVAEAAAIREDFDEWFGETENAGIRKTVSDWFADIQMTWSNWFGADAGSGIRKTFSDWFEQIQQAWTSWFGRDATEGVQKDWADTKADATAATGRANTAADVCEAWNTHPPYIGDGTTGDLNYWYLYDVTTSQYIKGPYAKGEDLDWDDMSQEDKDALTQMVLEHIAFDDVPAENSDHAVKSGGLYQEFSKKQDKLTFASDADCNAAAAEIVFTVTPEPDPDTEPEPENEGGE